MLPHAPAGWTYFSGGLFQRRIELTDELEIFFIQMLIFALAFLPSPFPFLPSAFGTFFEFLIFVDDETFADLDGRVTVSGCIRHGSWTRWAWSTYGASSLFIIVIFFVFFAGVVEVILGASTLTDFPFVVIGKFLLVIIQHGLPLDQIASAHCGCTGGRWSCVRWR
jgi:hypothetical protein